MKFIRFCCHEDHIYIRSWDMDLPQRWSQSKLGLPQLWPQSRLTYHNSGYCQSWFITTVATVKVKLTITVATVKVDLPQMLQSMLTYHNCSTTVATVKVKLSATVARHGWFTTTVATVRVDLPQLWPQSRLKTQKCGQSSLDFKCGHSQG